MFRDGYEPYSSTYHLALSLFLNEAVNTPEQCWFAMVTGDTGYFDDSRKDNCVFTVAGLLGNALQWQQFEEAWSILLDRHGVPYVHMKEMMRLSGPYAKWLPPEDHRKEWEDFFSDIVKIIGS